MTHFLRALAVSYLISSSAFAQNWNQLCGPYYPIRAVGSECTGDFMPILGTNACCKAIPGASASTPREPGVSPPPPTGNRLSAALALGGIGLQLASDLFGYLEARNAQRVAAEEAWRKANRQRISREQLDARQRAERWNATGMEAFRRNDMATAESHFAAAMKEATNGMTEGSLQELYGSNYHLARAYVRLYEANALEAEASYQRAANMLVDAADEARLGGRPDVAAKIMAQEARVRARSGERSQRRGANPSCVIVNGSKECD